jgi:hypothetical protein
MTTRESILAATKAKLSSLADGRVYRSRKEQFPALPAIVIRPDSANTEGDALGVTDWVFGVSVELYNSADTPDQAADPLLDQVLSLLSESNALGLGADVQIRPSRRLDWNFESYDDLQVVLHLDIDYRT